MTREPIWEALWARFSALPGIVTASRRLRHWNDVPMDQQPALFLAQGNEGVNPQTTLPAKHLLRGELYLYVSTAGGQTPGTVLNTYLDAIEAALPLHPIKGWHDLGLEGTAWARIEGDIETDEGTLGDQAVAIVPIVILAT